MLSYHLGILLCAPTYSNIFVMVILLYVFFFFILVVAALALNALAQLFLLPSPLYIAEKWFPLEQRPVVIGI